MGINRRTFAARCATGIAMIGAAASARADEKKNESAAVRTGTGPTVHELARDIPVVEETDVVVCGSGPAGIAAALAAARTGAKVRLLEVHGCLGGVWTSGLLTWIIDSKNKGGLMAEIIRKRDERDGQQSYRDGVKARHAGAICRVMAPIDVHSTDPSKMKGIEKQTMKAVPYDIPLRALIAKDVDGLMMAGRCISGDFIAHSSYRVTGNAVEMGQAAGATAALAATTGQLPQDVSFSEVRLALARLNYVPGPA